MRPSDALSRGSGERSPHPGRPRCGGEAPQDPSPGEVCPHPPAGGTNRPMP